VTLSIAGASQVDIRTTRPHFGLAGRAAPGEPPDAHARNDAIGRLSICEKASQHLVCSAGDFRGAVAFNDYSLNLRDR
jgi:hypothetical protein